MKEGGKLGLDSILELIKLGYNFANISKIYAIPKQTLDYKRDKLVKLGCIEKQGFGVWKYIKEVPIRPKDTLTPNWDHSKPIRGHAFMWKVIFDKKIEWVQVINNYHKKDKQILIFDIISNGNILKTIYQDKKTWLTKNGLIIYEPVNMEWFGRSAPESKGLAVHDLDLFIQNFLKEVGIRHITYKFTCSKEHFAHIKHMMAKQFNDNNKKIYVRCDDRHFWIDHSKGENEAESNNIVTSRQAQEYYEEQVKTGFSVKPSFILEGFKESKVLIDKTLEATKQGHENMNYLNENLKTHFKVLNKIVDNSERQTKLYEKLIVLLEEKKEKKE